MTSNILLYILILYKINGLPLTTDAPSKPSKPYEKHYRFEGDIVFPDTPTRGVLLRGNTVAWTNGIVPYEIASGYTSTSQQYIIATMAKMERLIAINNVKCVQFRPKVSTDQYYITIRNGDGCSSYVGQNTGITMERTVTLQENGCLDDGRVMHELLHALGFYHEQSRPDRDNYVRVNYQNIISGMERNFDKYDNSYVNTLNTSYDYGSVMHYERDAFSSNGLPTIEPLQAGVTIGQRDGMSVIDIQEVRLFYNCSSTGATFPPITTTTTVNPYTVNTIISSSLTTNTQTFSRDSSSNRYYYETFELTVPSYNYYRIFSSSSIDTYGYLYQQTFDPNVPNLNNIYMDDDSGGNRQFLMTIYLQPNIRYIVVFTTFAPLVTGSYTLTVSGSVTVNLRKTNITSMTTTTSRPTSATTTTLRLSSTIPTNPNSIYSSALTINSPTFNRYQYGYYSFYYEAIAITVSANGYYTFIDNSTVDSYGYLYLNNSNPLNITQNLLTQDDDSGGNLQFLITYYLYTSNQYILVQTTYGPNVTTPFIIKGSGPGQVSYTKLSINSTTTTTPRSSLTTTTNPIPTYSSALTTNSPTFNRQKNIYDNFYYEAIVITVSIDGYYTFIDNSTVDSYGYLFFNNFNSRNVTQYLLAQDDDNGGNLQFSIAYYLQTSNKYILVQTTYYPYTITSFTIKALGPGRVNFTQDNSASTTARPTTTTFRLSGRK